MSKLWIVVDNGKLVPYESLDKIVEGIENFAEFVVKQPQIVCLEHKNAKDWEIEAVSLTEIAKAVMERSKR